MNEVWLSSGETLQRVFFQYSTAWEKRLADSAMFLQWLRFIEKYKVKVGESSYSDRHALNFLLEARPLTPEVNLAAFFQSLQTVPDLKRLGNSLERNLFQRWMTTVDSKPKDVARLLNIGQSVPKLSKSDLRYKNFGGVHVAVCREEREGDARESERAIGCQRP